MDIAKRFEKRSRQKKRLAELMKAVQKDLNDLEMQMLDLMEQEKLPSRFEGLLGTSIYTREEIWASPAGGDHAALAAALRRHGLVEFLPSSINSQKLSAYVREHYNKQTGEFEGLPDDLFTALNITKKQRVISSG